MKVLIVLRNSPIQRYLISLYTHELITEIKSLIERQKHAQAVATVFHKGVFEKEIMEHELPALGADLILSEHSASWDLTC